jgi:TolB-like protein
MPSGGETDSHRPLPSVFLSYASQDCEAARLIRDALPAFGLEVWHDESDLGGGELWDQKIRKQIRECDYFMPLVSAQTEARHEGYFRREWRLAVERTLDMADDHPFLLPIVIDGTDQAAARVPEKFLTVQWLRVPGGRPTPALEALCRRIVSGDAAEPQAARAARKATARTGRSGAAALTLVYPEFPREEPGQRMRFGAQAAGWVIRSAWIFFKRLPRWIRIIAVAWLCIVVLSRGGSPRHHESADLSPASVRKLKTIADQYQGSSIKADVPKLGMRIAREISGDSGLSVTRPSPLLAIPFTAPAGDAAAEKLADSTFARVYGRIAVSHHGQVGLPKEPLTSGDLAAALERGRAAHSSYVLRGTVEPQAAAQALTVMIASVEDGSVVWSKSYPAAGADPMKIAAEVDSKVPSLDQD